MIPLPVGTQLAVFSEATLVSLWQRIKGFDNLFSEADMRDPESFMRLFLGPDTITIWVEDGGFVLLKNVRRGEKAEFHACFWDRKLSPRTELLQKLMVWIFLEFDLVRLESYVADYAKSVVRFLTKRLGFTLEGTMRQAWRHKGQLQDMHILSILKGEVSL